MPKPNRIWLAVVIVALIAIAIDFAATFLLRNPALSQAARITVALIPLPGDIVLIVLVIIGVRQLDEFQRHVQLEAVTIAFLASGVAVFVHGYLEKAHAVGQLSAGLVWAFMLVFYAIGYFVAASHYK